MMVDTRCKNVSWTIRGKEQTNSASWEGAQLAVLMDIRDELQALHRIFACRNFLAIPQYLRDVRRNTSQPKPKVRAKRKKS